MPIAAFINVVLPEPFSPKIAKISPLRKSRETFLLATLLPKDLLMLTNCSAILFSIKIRGFGRWLNSQTH